MNRLQAAVDAAWTAALIAAFAYIIRREIAAALVKTRAEIDERRREIDAARLRIEARQGWIAWQRARGIEPSATDLGMES